MSEPRILAVDTTFGACSAAVLEDERVLAAQHVVMERGHAEALAPMVDAVMRTAGLAFDQLDQLAVTTGPGTFTGQRVGLAFMRGLRVALQKPLTGITSLAAMAEQARRQLDVPVGAAVHDAKRGEVYLEVTGKRPVAACLLTFDAAAEVLRAYERMALAGTAASRLAQICKGVLVAEITAPDAVWVARLAVNTMSTSAPHPLYLRAPDAKLPGAR